MVTRPIRMRSAAAWESLSLTTPSTWHSWVLEKTVIWPLTTHPRDFETEEPYIVVNLDDVCRGQQFHEGWFSSFENVPRQAISMSIRQILKSR